MIHILELIKTVRLEYLFFSRIVSSERAERCKEQCDIYDELIFLFTLLKRILLTVVYLSNWGSVGHLLRVKRVQLLEFKHFQVKKAKKILKKD